MGNTFKQLIHKIKNWSYRVKGWLCEFFDNKRTLNWLLFIMIAELVLLTFIYKDDLLTFFNTYNIFDLSELHGEKLLKQKNEVVKFVLQFIGGGALLYGLYLNHKRLQNLEKQTETTEKGHYTERFTKAIEQLGSENDAIVLGGIYALANLAKDKAETYYTTVYDTLCAYVRNRLGISSKDSLDTNSLVFFVTRKDVTNKEVYFKNLPIPIQTIFNILDDRKNQVDNDKYDKKFTPDFTNTNFASFDLAKTNFDKARLNQTNLKHTNLTRVSFNKSILIETDFEGANLENVIFKDLHLIDSNLKDVNLQGALLEDVRINSSNLENTNFRGANFYKVECTSSTLNESNFSDTKINSVDFSNSKFQKARFMKSELKIVEFKNAKLEEAVFQNVNAIHDVSFQDANLYRANFRNVKFQSTVFSRAILKETKLQRTVLRNANFQGAKLQDAQFQGAKLEGANFQGALLMKTNFQFANLSNANLEKAIGITFKQLSLCKSLYGVKGLPTEIEEKLRSEKPQLFEKPKN